MSILKCKMCGGDLRVSDESKIVECEYCGTRQTVPDGNDEKKTNLFNRANRLRMENEFDKAAGVYESIVSEYPEESEGYWGLVLCAYGIEYVDDAKTGRKIPTCHRTVTTSVMDDDNFAQACENADIIAREVYRNEAKEIDRLQQKIISIVASEESYDVFICYKETDDMTKSRTEDSMIAQDIYTELVKEGYKVFFSHVTLREKAGTEYEPYIYAALRASKVMLAIGTKYDYYDAVWVKNEWSRYISMMSEDKEKHLIPCFKDLDAYDIPKEFKNLQALNIADMTFLSNLKSRIAYYIKKPVKNIIGNIPGADVEISNLFKRAENFLRDENFEKANEYFEKILDRSPEEASAYWGKLLCQEKCIDNADIQSDRMLEEIMVGIIEEYDVMSLDNKFLEQSLVDRWGSNYQNALRFASDDEKATFISYFSSFLSKMNETLIEVQKRTEEMLKEEASRKREEERIAEEKRKAEIRRKKREQELQLEMEQRAAQVRFIGHMINIALVAVFGVLLFFNDTVIEQMIGLSDSSFGGYMITRIIFLIFSLFAGIASLKGGGIFWPTVFVIAYPLIFDFIVIVKDESWSEDPLGTFFVFIFWMAFSLVTASVSSLIFGAISGTRKKK